MNIYRTLKRLGIVRPRSTQPKQDSLRLAGRGTRRPEKRTLAKKKGKRSITVVGRAFEQFGEKWLIHVHVRAIRAYMRLSS